MQIDSLPPREFAAALARRLLSICVVTDARAMDPEPPLSLTDFILLLLWSTTAPRQAYVYGVCLVVRLASKAVGAITINNIYRIFLCALIASSSMVEDTSATIEAWAYVVRSYYSYREVLLLYKTFLKTLAWDVLVPAAEFLDAATSIFGKRLGGELASAARRVPVSA